jgi:thiol-disulfide isomerase/thioredoxin
LDLNRRTVLTALALAASTSQAQTTAALTPGQAVPWPDMALLGGGRFGPEQAAGNAVVVVFWTTTCPFCRRHNQHVEKLHRAAAGKRLRVLGVARETDADAVAQYARAQGYSFPITLNQPALAQLLSPRRMVPMTVVVDRQGRLKQTLPGEMFEEDLLELLQLAA